MTTMRALAKIPGASPNEAAAAWAVRLDRGPLSQAEETEFAKWVADPVNDEALCRANDALHVFDADRLTDPNLRALRQAALAARPEPQRRFRPYLVTSLAAAVVAGFVLLGRSSQVAAPRTPVIATAASAVPSATAVAESSAQPIEYASDVGKRRSIPLPDGSTVTLNTNSQVAVSFTEGRRMIRLMRGQALFDVAHNPQRPFIVFAGDRRVTALGTIFEVRTEPSKMQVVLVRGSVVVDHANQQESTSSAKSSAPVLLEPGQGLMAEGNRQRVVKIDLKRELLWRTGFVEFADESLGHAVSEINRYTNRPIELSPDGVADLRVSGVFRTDDPMHFVETVSELLSIDVDSSKGGIKLSLAKKVEPKG